MRVWSVTVTTAGQAVIDSAAEAGQKLIIDECRAGYGTYANTTAALQSTDVNGYVCDGEITAIPGGIRLTVSPENGAYFRSFAVFGHVPAGQRTQILSIYTAAPPLYIGASGAYALLCHTADKISVPIVISDGNNKVLRTAEPKANENLLMYTDLESGLSYNLRQADGETLIYGDNTTNWQISVSGGSADYIKLTTPLPGTVVISRAASSGAALIGFYQKLNMKIYSDDELTLSFYAKKTGPGNEMKIKPDIARSAPTSAATDGIILTDDYRLITVTARLSKSTAGDVYCIVNSATPVSGTYSVTIKNIKLEIGKKRTEYYISAEEQRLRG